MSSEMQQSAVISDPIHAVMSAYDATTLNILFAGDKQGFGQSSKLSVLDGMGSCSIDVARTALETLQKLHEQKRDLLVLDLEMSGQRGLELLRIVQATHLQTRILVVCSFVNQRSARHILRAGAHGYLEHSQANSAELLNAVQTVLSGRHYLSDHLCQFLSRAQGNREVVEASPSQSLLSPLERQLYGRMMMGCSLATLAVELDLPEEAISACQMRLMEKINPDARA
jgi:DNA-binding NarL/FixJ family response regulator